ncbi:MAG TPA: elongation factor P [Dehalococcoidia bacterium]|nr:elongation factor P [Dehalococcoidia bacterium]HLE79879.1 elongation factor P [Dehalococcoidia bacterium]
MISTGDLKKGITIELDGDLYTILDYQHLKLGRGSAQVRMKLRHVRAGHITERTFQAGDRFPRAYLDRRPVQFLYQDGDLFHFMDTENFEQTALNGAQLGDAVSYLKENQTLDLLSYRGEPIGAELPITVELRIVETDPGFKGDTATGGNKLARLETGLTTQVPLFINTGDVIKVDTRTGTYIERV